MRQSMVDYLRAQGFEMEADPNGSLRAPLIDNEDGNSSLDDIDLFGSNVPPKQAFNGQIRLKTSDKSDTTEDSTEYDDEIYIYEQFARRNPIESTVIFQDNQCLSPTKPTAKAIIFFIHVFDFAFGSFLIARGCTQMRDEYGSLTVSLILGLLLLVGAIAGTFLHTPLSKWFENQPLTLFNIAFGFISCAIYYILALLLLTSMATMTTFVGTELNLSEQFALCILGLSVSVGEVYRIMYVQQYYLTNEESEQGQTDRSNNGSAEEIGADSNDVENASAIPSVLFV